MKAPYGVPYLALVILSTILPGCGSLYNPVTDNAKESQEKGHVLFYTNPKLPPPFWWTSQEMLYQEVYAAQIHKIVGNETIDQGSVATSARGGAGAYFRQISEQPGNYRYVVCVGNHYDTMGVQIKKGMLRPIRIDILEKGKEFQGAGGRAGFATAIKFDVQYSLMSYTAFGAPSASEMLIGNLDSNDWEIRWLSCYLIGCIQDRQAILPLRGAAQSDADPHVRGMAKRALEEIGD